MPIFPAIPPVLSELAKNLMPMERAGTPILQKSGQSPNIEELFAELGWERIFPALKFASSREIGPDQQGQERDPKLLYPDDLLLEYQSVEADQETGIAVYRGGVKVRWNGLILLTDTLILRQKGTRADLPEIFKFQDGTDTIDLKENEAYAKGKVRLTAPEAEISIENLRLNLRANPQPDEIIGRAENFRTEIPPAWIRAREILITPALWKVNDVSFSTSDRKTPYYQFNARELNLIPGKRGTARGVRFQVLGQTLPTIPSISFTLDPRRRATQLPQVSVRQREGLGVTWGANFAVRDNGQISGNIASFPRIIPTYDLQYAISKVPQSQSGFNQLRSGDDFGERSPFTYFANIFLNGIENPRDIMAIKRDMVTIGTAFNVGTFGRQSDFEITYSRPIELVLEKGGIANIAELKSAPNQKFAYFSQTRLQTVREQNGASLSRLAQYASLATPIVRRGRLDLGFRFDAGAFLSSQSHGYIGGEGGATYTTGPFLKLSAGVYGYKNLGTPFFVGDQFNTNQGVSIRADVIGKATNLAFIWRYDPTQGWFDRQFRITQVVGPVEPVMVYRQNPNFYQIGINFRIDSVLSILQNRNQKPVPKPIPLID